MQEPRPTTANSPKRLSARRGLRFSLRSLLVLVTIVGVYFGVVVNPALRRHRAVSALKSLGADVRFDFEPRSGRTEVGGQSPVPKWILDFTGPAMFHDIVEVEISGHDEHVTAAIVKYLPVLTQLENVELSGSAVTDDCLAVVSELPKLEQLSLAGVKFTDQGIAHLKSCPRLWYLRVWNPTLTNESLRHIGEMRQLVCLILQQNNFSDAGLVHIRNLDRLEILNLDRSAKLGRSKITNQGLWAFRGMTKLRSLSLPDIWLEGSELRELTRLSNDVGTAQ